MYMVEVPAYGGTLTEGIIGTPRFINPVLASSDADRDLVALTHSGLLRPDNRGRLIKRHGGKIRHLRRWAGLHLHP